MNGPGVLSDALGATRRFARAKVVLLPPLPLSNPRTRQKVIDRLVSAEESFRDEARNFVRVVGAIALVMYSGMGALSTASNQARAAFESGNFGRARRFSRPLSILGDTQAQRLLGSMYAVGRGVAKDEIAARRWLLRAAQRGDAEAQFALGVVYARVSPVDLTEAARWYGRAAVQGVPKAQYRLALAYQKGEGVARDARQAYLWFFLANARGVEGSEAGLKQAAQELAPDQRIQAEAEAGWVASAKRP